MGFEEVDVRFAKDQEADRLVMKRGAFGNDADLSSPPTFRRGRLHSLGGIAAHPHGLEDPCGPFRPSEGSKPESAVSSRRSAASREVLAVDHSPASSTSRGAPRGASVSSDTEHPHCGRLMARIGSDPSRRSRSRTVVHRPVVDGDPDDRAVEQPSRSSRYRAAGVIFFARSPVMPNTTNASARRSSLVLAGGEGPVAPWDS